MSASTSILVTGATGFIGRHLVQQLLAQSRNVRVLCRSVRKAEQLFGTRVEWVEGDLASPVALTEACRGIEVVYNAAGLYRFGVVHRAELWRVNVEGTRNVLQSARRAGVRRVVHCSTAGVLSASGRPANHLDFPQKPPPLCGYKGSKWHGEVIALQAAKEGQDVVITSPTAPIGSGDEHPTPTGRMILDLKLGRFPGCTRTGINLVAVQDVARGMIDAAAHGVSGHRYIFGHENLWLDEFLARVAVPLGCRPPRAWVPWGCVAAAGIVADLGALLTGFQFPQVCWETAYSARKQQFFDLEPTYQGLGWRPEIPIDRAIAEAIDWFEKRLETSRAKTESDRPRLGTNECRSGVGGR